MLEDTDGSNPNGSGLGLNICRIICEKMGGKIGCTSEYEIGSKFAFTLPFKVEEIPVEIIEEVKEANNYPTPKHRESIKETDIANEGSALAIPLPFVHIKEACENIQNRQSQQNLLNDIIAIDDNPFNIFTLQTIIERFGICCDSCFDANTLLDKVKNRKDQPYRLILMDIEMPLIDGFKAYQMLREYWNESGLSVIPTYSLTAHTSEEIKAKVLEYGMAGCRNIIT